MALRTTWGHSTAGVTPTGWAIPNANVPTWLTSSLADFSGLFWWKSGDLAGHTAFRGIFGIDGTGGTAGGFYVWYRNSQLGIGLYLDDGSTVQAAISATNVDTQDEWTLIGFSIDVANRTLSIFARNSSSGSTYTASNTWDVARSPAGATADLVFMGPVRGWRQPEGTLGLCCLRKGDLIASSDIDALWSTTPSIFDLVNRSAGNMSGDSAQMLMVGHCICGNPGDSSDLGPLPGDLASDVGDAGLNVYIQTGSTHNPDTEYTNIHGANWQGSSSWDIQIDDMRAFISGSDGLTALTTDVPGRSTDGVRTGYAPTAYRAGTGAPSQEDFVLVWSNSRGMRTTDHGGATRAANHAMGYVGELEAQVRGVLGVPVWQDLSRRWFGFDNDAAIPPITGTVGMIYGGDLERMGFSGGLSVGPNATGPGAICWMRPSAVCYKFAQEETASLMLKGKAWRMRLHVWEFPGSTDSLFWREATADDTAGSSTTLIGASDTEYSGLDTTAATHTWGASDVYGDQIITISGVDLTGSVSVGDLVVITAGVAAGSAAQVTSIGWTGSTTLIGLSHDLTTGPSTGDTLKFGPFTVRTIDWTAAASSQAAKGMRLTADSGGYGVLLAAVDCWVDGEAGFVFGSAGWGGQGYSNQIDGYFDGALAKMMAALGPTEVWLHNATQGAVPADMLDFAAELRGGVAQPRIVLLSDMQHKADGTAATWQDYMLTTQTLYPASGVMESSNLGSRQEMFQKGWYYDEPHPELEGMQALAAEHLGQFASMHSEAAGGPFQIEAQRVFVPGPEAQQVFVPGPEAQQLA